MVDDAVGRVAGGEALPAVVDQVVGGVLPGILDSALPVAIDKLGEQPELIEGLVNSILGASSMPPCRWPSTSWATSPS